ncbi:guanine nucleotide releasing protein [Trypanosoma grayi]|uniref:guanine nucleotide releasing protein n=1 Tax=Trypanosoma grayi TaxID=71804 RepID=UPI0004F43654|nr:guanine nucleotide releasing protein [Trypanosoma grayi]KEG09240.1 guanine nucleotide releasing protein [Trypanosoma grayi]
MSTLTGRGQTRLYVRMEGLCPFALLLDDDASADVLERAARHYACERYGLKADAEHVMVRRILFTGGDQLIDFALVRKKRLPEDLPDAESTATPARNVGRNFAFVDVLPAYHNSDSPDAVRESYRTGATSALDDHEVTAKSRGAKEAWDAAALLPSPLYFSFVAFNRLVLMMTDPRGLQRELLTRVVLLTYRQFVSADELLERLIERYEVPPLVKLGEADRSPLEHHAYVELCREIQCTVFSVLELWVKSYYEDFSNDALHLRLHVWAKDKIDRCGAPTALLRLMAKGDRRALHARTPKILPGIPRKGGTPTALLIQHTPNAIAAQLTILTSHVHRHLTGPELIGQRWKTEEVSFIPNFIQYRDFFFRVNNWASYAVVSERDLERRTRNLTALMSVCDELIKLRNWDMLVAVYGGLRDPAVVRLSLTWAALSGDDVALFAQLQKLLDSDTGYKTLKNAMQNGERPQFPCIAVFFQELRDLEEGRCSQEGRVNFGRCLQQYRLLQFVLLGSGAQVDQLVPDSDLMGAFSFWRPVDASVLMDLSNEVEGN